LSRGGRIIAATRASMSSLRQRAFESAELPVRGPLVKRALARQLARRPLPRVVVVKQDVHDDLYACAPGASPAEIVLSTVFRSGPVALFTRLGADFRIVRTEPDPECRIWEQKWTERRWAPLEYFEAFRDHIPGRSYGNGAFAASAADVDWSQYDVVISSDVAVPARITRRYPRTVWCYYVREVKTSAYERSLHAPLEGQDLHLTQGFRPVVPRSARAPHNVEFPYFLQHPGCFHELLGRRSDTQRQGIFLEHHTDRALGARERAELAGIAPITSPAREPPAEGPDIGVPPHDHIERLLASKYFVKSGGRHVWGNSMIEAIAAGSVAIGDPAQHECPFLYDDATSARSLAEVRTRLEAFERDPQRYQRALGRQQALIDYLCYARPMLRLLEKADEVRRARCGPR
jgi:hypothetical protein